jgi:cell division protein FtsW
LKDILSTYFKGDRVIWIVIAFLSVISIVSVYSSIGDLAYRYMSGNTSHYLFRHLRFLLVGFAVLYLLHRVPYTLFFSLSQLIIIVAGLLLFFTLFLGVSENDATRWLDVGFRFQPSDIAKFALIVYIARVLSLSQDNEESLTLAFKKIIIPVGIICGLILPSNFSTAFLLFTTSLILMFIGRLPGKLLLKSVGILAGILVFIGLLAFAAPDVGRLGTWKSRIESFWNDSSEDDFQANLAKTAIATSGLVGKGPGNSSVRYSLPNASSDFIYSIILEEWGSIIGFLVLASYLLILYRTGMIVKASSRTFPAFLAIGLSVSLVFQALANMAVAVNIVPVTGQPLPLVSMGGTSMISTFAALGIILSISRSLENEEVEENLEIEEEEE